MALPRISLSQARNFMLQRQLLHRPDVAPEEVVRSLVAIQAQYIRNVPLSFWSRSSQADLDWVFHALNEERSLVKTWCMRMTVHVLLSEELPFLVSAVSASISQYQTNLVAKKTGMKREQIQALEAKVMQALADGPLEREAIHARVTELRDIPGAGWGHDVKGLALRGELVFAGDGGSVFARRDQWLPDLERSLPDPKAARMQLLRRYLASYGPARLQDFAYWAGQYIPWARSAFEDLQAEMVQVALEDHGDDYFILAKDLDHLQQPPDPPALALAPKFDPLMLAHKESHRFLPREHSKQVARAAGQVEAIVLVDGVVQATWRLKELKNRLVLSIEPVKAFSQSLKTRLQAEADKLAAFYGRDEAEVNWL